MNRKEFFQKSLQSGFGCCGLLALQQVAKADDSPKEPEDLKKLKFEKEFVQNWLSDLLETMDAELDAETKYSWGKRMVVLARSASVMTHYTAHGTFRSNTSGLIDPAPQICMSAASGVLLGAAKPG